MSLKPDGTVRTIAIVEDEASVRQGLRRLCTALGMNPTVFASGREFLDSLDHGANPPDCLLLDAHMPLMSGLELHQQLVGRGLRLPTVVYTADDAPEAEARYRAAGVTEYLRKPIKGEELLDAIDRVMPGARRAANPASNRGA